MTGIWWSGSGSRTDARCVNIRAGTGDNNSKTLGHFLWAAIPFATPNKPVGPSSTDLTAVEVIVGEAQVPLVVAR